MDRPWQCCTTFGGVREDFRAAATCLWGILSGDSISHARNCQESVWLADGKERLDPMHDLLIAAAFLLMVILPCIVTMGSSSMEDGDEF